MISKKIIDNFSHKCCAAFLMLALMWLTVSTPFVISFNQEMAKHVKMEKNQPPSESNDEESSNNLGNNSEEKVPTNAGSFSEEYLHDSHHSVHFITETAQYYKLTNEVTYTAFHGELLVPPPNFS